MAGLATNRGRKRAREARRALGLRPDAPLPCLLTVVEDHAKLPVVITDRLPDDVAGACFREHGGAVLWVNGGHGRTRQRFTLAHELGHAWCGHDGALELDTFATLSGRTTNPREIEANAFAAEFLVPKAGIEQLVEGEPTLEDVVVIAARHGVSAIVVVLRIDELGLASQTRVMQLRREVGERLHEVVSGHLGLVPLDDRLGAIDRLPYLSPALDGTLLAAAVGGSAPVGARAAGAIDRRL